MKTSVEKHGGLDRKAFATLSGLLRYSRWRSQGPGHVSGIARRAQGGAATQ